MILIIMIIMIMTRMISVRGSGLGPVTVTQASD